MSNRGIYNSLYNHPLTLNGEPDCLHQHKSIEKLVIENFVDFKNAIETRKYRYLTNINLESPYLLDNVTFKIKRRTFAIIDL